MRSARRKISDNYIKYIIWKRRIFFKVDRRDVQYIKVKKVAVVISFAWKKKKDFLVNTLLLGSSNPIWK